MNSTKPGKHLVELSAWVSEENIQRLLSGEEDAWREFFDRSFDTFTCAIRTAGIRTGVRPFPPKGRSFDVWRVDAMTRFYENFMSKFDRFRGEREFFSFLFRSVEFFVRQAVNRPRAVDRKTVSFDLDGMDKSEFQSMISRSDTNSDDDRFDALRECLAKLPGRHRSIIQLRHFSERKMMHEEIAESLSSSPKIVSKQYRQILAQLKNCITIKLSGSFE